MFSRLDLTEENVDGKSIMRSPANSILPKQLNRNKFEFIQTASNMVRNVAYEVRMDIIEAIFSRV